MLASRSSRTIKWLATAGASALALSASAAFAQDQAAPAASSGFSGVEEIVVTAQRRAENLQDTPIAITALTASSLQASGISDLTGVVQATPSLYFAPYPNSSTTLVLFMRGQGAGDPALITKDGGIGVYLDGIYLSRPQTSTFDLADVERVEVLRGPQGTLYGRNTTGGAVNIVTRKPSGEFNVRGQVSVGNYDYRRALLNVDLPEFGDFKVKLTGLYSDRDGWAKNSGKGDGVTPSANNFQTDRKYAGRAAVRWEPADNVTVDYSADYSNIRTTPVRYVTDHSTIPGYNNNPKLSYRPVYLPFSKTKSDGQSLIVDWEASDGLTLRSLSGYRHLNFNAYQDYTEAFGGGFVSDDYITSKQYTQEFQAVGSIGDRIKYVGGLYYFLEKATHAQTLDLGIGANMMMLSDRDTYAKSISKAVYGQVTWTPSILDDNLELTVGGRYTEDKRTALRTYSENLFIGAVSPYVYRGFLGAGTITPLAPTNYGATDVKNKKFNPSFIANYKITPDVTVYGKVVTGYKAGGSNEASPTFTRTFKPETVTSYEAGLKTDLFDRRVRFNLTGFLAKYKDLQLDISANAVNAALVDTFNVGRATVKGIETDLTIVPIEDMTLTASYSFVDYKIKNVTAPAGSIFDPVINANTPVNVGDDITGYFVLPFTPKHSLRVSGDWTFLRMDSSSLALHVDYTWKDKAYTTAGNGPSVPTGRNFPVNPSYGLLDGRLTYMLERDGGRNMSVSLWGKNILDKKYAGYVIGSGSIIDGFYSQARSYGDPATYGVEVSFNF